MWLATFVNNIKRDYHNICCADEIDDLLKHVLDYKYSEELSEWQKEYKESNDKGENILDIVGGIRIIFKDNIYMEMKDIDMLVKKKKLKVLTL